MHSSETIITLFFEEGISRAKTHIFGELIAPGAQIADGFPIEESGPEGMKLRVTSFKRAFPDLRVSIEDVINECDRTVVRWSAIGTHRGELSGIAPTYRKVGYTGITIFAIREGIIEGIWTEQDSLGILEQIGALPALRSMPKQLVDVSE